MSNDDDGFLNWMPIKIIFRVWLVILCLYLGKQVFLAIKARMPREQTVREKYAPKPIKKIKIPDFLDKEEAIEDALEKEAEKAAAAEEGTNVVEPEDTTGDMIKNIQKTIHARKVIHDKDK